MRRTVGAVVNDAQVAAAARAYVSARAAYDGRDRDDLVLLIVLDTAWSLLVATVNADQTVDTEPL